MASRNLTAEQESAWIEWLALRDKALETGNLADGIASGRAFGHFHTLFIDRELRGRNERSNLLKVVGGTA